jgi:cell division protein YceG involved in septum cleavage
MLKQWFDENVTMADIILLSIVFLGVIALIVGANEVVTAAMGSASTYLVKDKSRRTKQLEQEIKEERVAHEVEIETAISGARVDDSVTYVNQLLDRLRSGERRYGGDA